MGDVRNVLTIAGSDSGGGAGVQADLKTFQSLGAYGLSVLTALTSQNTRGVDGIEAPPSSFVAKQLRAVTSDIRVDAAKTGMLYNTETICAIVSAWTSAYPTTETRPPLVVDPVMVSSSGHRLLESTAEATLIRDLLPLSSLVTPNLPEAAILAGWTDQAVESDDDVRRACKKIASRGVDNVLIKGGHAKGEAAIVDVLYQAKEDRFTALRHERLDTRNTHGTGCTLSAAVATFLAQGMSVLNAVKSAIDYVHAALQSSDALSVGQGFGPLNHGHNTIPRALPLPSRYRPHPFTDHMVESCRDLWDVYIRTHPFVRGVADGTLPSDCFVHFLRQDYIFLKHYARIHALAAFKCDTIDEIDATTDIVKHITRESRLHVERCKEWQITEAEFHATEESNHTVAYTRFVVDIGLAKSLLHLRVATSPCLLGYGQVGQLLHSDPMTKRDGNPYWPWICEYAGDDFQTAVRMGRDLLERTVQEEPLGPRGLAEMADIFRKAVKLEIGFWQMAMDKS